MSKNGLRIDANYTEEVVGFALESFLATMAFPRSKFTIEPFSRSKERWLGADARLYSSMRGFRPFYMQFKRPSAYPNFSSSKIIRQRQSAGLNTDPNALYFSLRRKQDSHSDYQHNVLLRLRERLQRRGIGDAAYVCPLFLDRSTYRETLHRAGLARWPQFWRHHPWEMEDVLIEDGGARVRFDRLPILAEHITVPPHKAVGSALHSYSFTEAGTELCFHSPQALPDGSMNLATYLGKLTSNFLHGEKLKPEASTETLNELVSAVYGERESAGGFYWFKDVDPIGRWFDWGEHLRTAWGIEQYAFVRWEDDAFAPF